MSTLIVSSKAVAHSDSSAASNDPRRKHFDWTRERKVDVSNPKSNEEVIPAGGSFTFFNGTVTTLNDGTTAWTITKSPLGGGRYRFTAVSGTAPNLRTDRNLTLNTQTLVVTDNGDGSALMSLGGGTWGTTAAGDTLWLPGPQTGDAASPFNVLNQGAWVVLAVLGATVLQVTRPAGTAFSVSGELVTITANSQVQTFTAAGLQPGDKADITAAFAPSTQRTYVVDQVTPMWFEVISTTAIALEASKMPGSAGLSFYSEAKLYLSVETDQEIALRINGMTDDKLRVSPFQAGAADLTGWHEHTGPCWSLVVVNKSSQPATVILLTAE